MNALIFFLSYFSDAVASLSACHFSTSCHHPLFFPTISVSVGTMFVKTRLSAFGEWSQMGCAGIRLWSKPAACLLWFSCPRLLKSKLFCAAVAFVSALINLRTFPHFSDNDAERQFLVLWACPQDHYAEKGVQIAAKTSMQTLSSLLRM